MDTIGDHGRIRDAELELVGDNGLVEIFLQQPDLHRLLIGYTKVAHFATLVQAVKCLCHFLRLNQGIRPVQQQDVEIVCFQPFQAAVHRSKDMFPGKIEFTFADAAFGLQDHRLAYRAVHVDGSGELAFARPTTIDIGMVKKMGTGLQGSPDKRRGGFLFQAVDPHAADRNSRHSQATFSELNGFHGETSSQSTASLTITLRTGLLWPVRMAGQWASVGRAIQKWPGSTVKSWPRPVRNWQSLSVV